MDKLSPQVGLNGVSTPNTGLVGVARKRVSTSSFRYCTEKGRERPPVRFGIAVPNIPDPPKDGGAIAPLDMFENLVSDNFD